MTKDTVIELKKPEPEVVVQDILTELARQGAQKMLTVALEQEVRYFVAQYADQKTDEGTQRVVRNGNLPERHIQTGIGNIAVSVPRVRDRAIDSAEKITFSSAIVPPYLRRSKSLETLLPLLYLRGISSGDFQNALSPLLGEGAKNLSPNVISHLKTGWETEYQRWQRRDLSSADYVYFWADGIYLQARMEEVKDCILVIVGVTSAGHKEVVAIDAGYRESKESWQSLLRDLKRRGLPSGAQVATGDGALGFWAALEEEYPHTRHQRCWVHKTVNVLDKLPKPLQARAKSSLHEIWMSETKAQAEKSFDQFIADFSLKYPKATECLAKDRDPLLTFYDFPAEHWKSLRTTNPIESTFATVRHRTKRSKGCFSRKTIVTMVFKLCESAQKSWIRLRGFDKLAEVIRGVKFVDGLIDKSARKIDQCEAA